MLLLTVFFFLSFLMSIYRMCPGRHFAHQSLYIAIASLLWAFDMRKSKDSSGHLIEPSRSAVVNDGLVV